MIDRLIELGGRFISIQKREFLGIICAAVLVAIQIVGTILVVPRAPSQSYVIFEATFAFITLWVGRAAALWAIGLGAASIAYFLLRGEGFAVADPIEALGLIAFIVAGLGIVDIVSHLRSNLRFSQERLDALAVQDVNRSSLHKELMHRIGNDLGALVSAAELQAATSNQVETSQALTKMADRIHVLGNVYRRLNVSDRDIVELEMPDFLKSLCDDLRTAHLSLRPISLEIRSEPINLSASEGVLVGLILNEAVTNALKHAFPEDRAGIIRIRFEHDPSAPDFLILIVMDDGIGPTNTPEQGAGMGQRLMRGMASQLRGTFALVREQNTTIVKLRFRDGR